MLQKMLQNTLFSSPVHVLYPGKPHSHCLKGDSENFLKNFLFSFSLCGSQNYYRVACLFPKSQRVGERQVLGENNILLLEE